MTRTQVLAGLANLEADKAAVAAGYQQLGDEEEVAYQELHQHFAPRRRALEAETPEDRHAASEAWDELDEEESGAYTVLEKRFDSRHDQLDSMEAGFYSLSKVTLHNGEPIYVDVQKSESGTLTEVTNFTDGDRIPRQASFLNDDQGFAILGIALVGDEEEWYRPESLEAAQKAAFDWAAQGLIPTSPQVPSQEGHALLTQRIAEIVPF